MTAAAAASLSCRLARMAAALARRWQRRSTAHSLQPTCSTERSVWHLQARAESARRRDSVGLQAPFTTTELTLQARASAFLAL